MCCVWFNVGIYRLDRLTSGIMIFSKTEAKTKEMMELMQKRQLQKEYVCRVDGEFPRYHDFFPPMCWLQILFHIVCIRKLFIDAFGPEVK